jgi:ABC-type branched-subunit amino acid transport system substrate-binding protein
LYRRDVSLSPGDRVDRYEVIELLGAGGMGEVYRARDPKLARPVALKILHVDRSSGTDGPGRLLREARVVAALSHANVVAVFDVGEVETPEAIRGLPYIAMELVVGRSLGTYVGDESIPIERRLGWLRDVANALGAAHHVGIVHRDMKPENVMIRVDGVVKVLDFGIARRRPATVDADGLSTISSAETAPAVTGPSTALGGIVGTPFYMAPEQLRGEPLDGRADQFSWGVMAYLLLTGKPPWTAGDSIGVLSQILSRDPTPPSSVTPDVPATVSRVILKALSKQRDDRFASMEALVAALDGTSPDEPAATTQRDALAQGPGGPPAAQSGGATPRRGPARASVFWGGVAIVAAIAGTIALSARQAPPTATDATRAAGTGNSAPACVSNRECVASHGGETWRCHTERHACVEVASPECHVHAAPGVAEADDVVWLGGLFPLSNQEFDSESRAADLARQDFDRVLGPSAGRSGELHARPIGLVLCDEGRDLLVPARHLVDDVQVPAVLGFGSTRTALAAIPEAFLPAKVLSFVTISQATSVTKIPESSGEPRLVWRSTLRHDGYVAPLTHVISDVLEPAARSGPQGIGARAYKVAMAWQSESNADLMEALFGALRFNDGGALENTASFRQFTFDDEGSAATKDAVEGLLAFAPDVIVYAGAGERVIAPLEARWTGRRRPYYLTAESIPREIFEIAGRDPARRRRFLSVNNLSTTMTNAALVLRYNLAFPKEPIVRSEAPQPSYDAFYMLAYAVYATGDAPVTGPALSLGIQKLLPPGPKFDVGPGAIFDAFRALRAGGRIDLNGAIGSLDFDPATGEAPIDYSIICPGVDDRGAPTAPVDSGLVYDSRKGALVGTLRCS